MPVGDNSTACPTCWDAFERMVGEIPALVDDLETAIARQARISLVTGYRATPEPEDERDDDVDPKRALPGLRALRAPAMTVTVAASPAPFHIGAAEALRLLHATMWPWVREALEMHPDVYLPDPSTIGLSRALLRICGWLQGHPDGSSAIDGVSFAVSACRRVIDLAPDRWYVGPCNGELEGIVCGEQLYVTVGRGSITCSTCGTEHDVAERRTAMLEAADEMLLTLSDLTRAINMTGGTTVSRKQLEGWVRRGRLVRSGNDGPVALYRVSDARGLVEKLNADSRVST